MSLQNINADPPLIDNTGSDEETALLKDVISETNVKGSERDKRSIIKRRKRKVPKQGEEFNQVESTILQRRSVRTFKSKQLPDYIVSRILETARYAPSAGNCQSWKFVVVQDAKVIQEMTDHIVKLAGWTSRFMHPGFPKAVTNNWLSRRMMKSSTGLFHPTGLSGLSQVAKKELDVWHGAPTVVFILVDGRSAGDPHLDVGIAGTNMVLTAHSYGLGTCWVSFSTLLEASPKFRKYLGIGYPYRLATSIAIGYPKGIPDGFVERETHETIWYDSEGNKKYVY